MTDKNEKVNSNQDNFQEVESALNTNVSQIGLTCQAKSINSVGSHVDFGHIDQSPVKEMRLYTEKIKTALVEVSVGVQISPEKARKEDQIFSKNVTPYLQSFV